MERSGTLAEPSDNNMHLYNMKETDPFGSDSSKVIATGQIPGQAGNDGGQARKVQEMTEGCRLVEMTVQATYNGRTLYKLRIVRLANENQ